eukprot:TRINITY_DN3891_c0_g2_i1.p1 TRINITY_DN3891_c0_g2~~TRINITY_DN3891_c0_g2_i1.p1  ORF type:complete len:102 (+),score=11.11 TRINITY_DN3891_c0_g2_i1:230-535(+)
MGYTLALDRNHPQHTAILITQGCRMCVTGGDAAKLSCIHNSERCSNLRKTRELGIQCLAMGECKKVVRVRARRRSGPKIQSTVMCRSKVRNIYRIWLKRLC